MVVVLRVVVKQCSVLSVYQRFGGTSSVPSQGELRSVGKLICYVGLGGGWRQDKKIYQSEPWDGEVTWSWGRANIRIGLCPFQGYQKGWLGHEKENGRPLLRPPELKDCSRGSMYLVLKYRLHVPPPCFGSDWPIFVMILHLTPLAIKFPTLLAAILKMEAACSSLTLVYSQKTTLLNKT